MLRPSLFQDFMIFMTHRLDLDLHAFQDPRFHILVLNVHPGKAAMRALKVQLLESTPNFGHLGWRQRYHIRDRPHECVARRPWRPVDVI